MRHALRHGRLQEAKTVTLLLRDFQQGDDAKASRLVELIYPELKKLAQTRFRAERGGHLLQPTALVHEAYLKLVEHDDHNWESRAHFYAAAANVMRRILIDTEDRAGAITHRI